MYLQITTKCNMKCGHCMFSCRPGRGKDMPMDTFVKAVNIALDYGSSLTIGGGEPTLHPNIILMLGYVALLSDSDYGAFMITNGTCNEDLWNVLLRAKEKGNLGLAVSYDPWHDVDLIKPWVWKDADAKKMWWGKDGYRTIVKRGRAKSKIGQLEQDASDWGYDKVFVTSEDCTEPRVDPYGIVWADTNKKNRVGELNEDSIGKAYEIIQNYQNQ